MSMPLLEPLLCFPLTRPVDLDPVREVERLASQVFGIKNFLVTTDGAVHLAQEVGGARLVEWNPVAGTIWMADWSQLWNADARPHLPARELACTQGLTFLRSHALLPHSHGDLQIEIGRPIPSGTLRNAPNEHTPSIRLDVHVAVPVSAQLKGREVPLNGRGQKWSITFGNRGEIINCVAGRLNVTGEPRESDPLFPPPQLSDTTTRGGLEGGFESRLVYERFEDVDEQAWLLPMFLTLVDSIAGPQLTRFPATEFSKEVLDRLSERQRPDKGAVAGSPAEGTTLAALRDLGLPESQLLGGTWSVSGRNQNGLRTLESQAFVDEMRGRSWTMQSFDDGAALEDHWNARRGEFVEMADLAHYAGHAGPDGWLLNDPASDKMFDLSDVDDRSDPVMFGRQCLNWIVISACGPLQDEGIRTANDSAIGRWQPAFGGLMGLCGFASTSLGHPDMGAVFARGLAYHSVTRAWLRACRECEPLIESLNTLDGLGVWAATVTPEDEDLRTHDARVTDGRSDRPRGQPGRLMGMWTPA
jgi:hypothetical protein